MSTLHSTSDAVADLRGDLHGLVAVDLGVDLRHVGFGVAKHQLGGFEADLLAKLRGRVVV